MTTLHTLTASALLAFQVPGLAAEHLGELDLAVGHKMFASAGNGARYAADKNVGTKFESGDWRKWPQWLACDLEQPRTVHKVVIRLQPKDKDYPAVITYELAVQGSADNVSYADLAAAKSVTFDESNGFMQTIEFPAAQARYVRLFVTRSSLFDNRSFLLGEWSIFTREPIAPHPGTFETRRDWIVDQLARRETTIELRDGLWAARLVKGIDTDHALAMVKRDLTRFKGTIDPFFTYLVAGRSFTPEMVALLKRNLTRMDYAKAPFCSINFLYRWMVLGYLVGEYLPDVPDVAGRQGPALVAYARDTLLYPHLERQKLLGHAEYGSTEYTHFSYGSINMLAEFAKDPEVRKRAVMLREVFLVNWALDWNGGGLISPITRAKVDGWISHNPTLLQQHAVLAWAFFGSHRPLLDFGTASHPAINAPGEENYLFWSLYGPGFKVPEIISRMASRTDYAFRKRVRWADFCKQTDNEGDIFIDGFKRPSFGLATQNERSVFDHGSATRCLLRWHSAAPDSTFWVAVAHPGGTGNNIGALTGDVNHHRMMQHRYTVIGTVNGAPDRNNNLRAVFPANGAVAHRTESGGWIFAHGGSVLFAYRPAAPFVWESQNTTTSPLQRHATYDHDVACSEAVKNGYILESSDVTHFAGGGATVELERFKAAVLERSCVDFSRVADENPRIIYKSLHGYTLDFTAPRKASVNGKTTDYDRYKLVDAPGAQQDFQGEILTLSEGGEIRTYDFTDWTVTQH